MKKFKLVYPLIGLIPAVSICFGSISCSQNDKYSEKDIDTVAPFDLRFNEIKGENLSLSEASDMYYDLVLQHPEVLIDTFRYNRYNFWNTQKTIFGAKNIKETFSIENLSIEKIVDGYDVYLKTDFDVEIISKASNLQYCPTPASTPMTAWDFTSKIHAENIWFRITPIFGTYTMYPNMYITQEVRETNDWFVNIQNHGYVESLVDGEKMKVNFANIPCNITSYFPSFSEEIIFEFLPFLMLFMDQYSVLLPYLNNVTGIPFISTLDSLERNIPISSATDTIEWDMSLRWIVPEQDSLLGCCVKSYKSNSLFIDDLFIDEETGDVGINISPIKDSIEVNDTITFDLDFALCFEPDIQLGAINTIKQFKVTFVED